MAEERGDLDDPTSDPELDRNVEDLERSSDKLEDTIRETKRDWEAKQADEAVPGAQPEPDEGELEALEQAEPESGDSESGDEGDSEE